MTDNVLDLIDNVVEEHELLSADAMRWAPDAPDPTPGSKAVAFVRDGLGQPLTPWQANILRADVQRAYVAATRPFVAALDEFVRVAAAEFARLGERIRPCFVIVDEIHAAEAAKRARLRRMHTEYSRRNRGR